MRALIVFNPVSGRGRAAAMASSIETRLRAAGHDAECCETSREPAARWLEPRLDGADVAVVAGGDGAVRMIYAAVGDRVLLWHHPAGTENLFARHFGMTRDPAQLAAALDAGREARVDAAEAGSDPFLLMTSVGLDAEVVHDLSARRGAAISHASYAVPIARQLMSWRPPILEVEVDGEVIVSGRPGVVVVANAREYGARLDPAWAASMTDGLLDVVWLPVRGTLGLLARAAACRAGRQAASPHTVHERGRTVVLRSETPFRFQVDGDPPSDADRVSRLELRVRPSAARVLLPA